MTELTTKNILLSSSVAPTGNTVASTNIYPQDDSSVPAHIKHTPYLHYLGYYVSNSCTNAFPQGAVF